jgi:hypothetical protein
MAPVHRPFAADYQVGWGGRGAPGRHNGPVRAIFFDEDDARAVVARLRADGFEAHIERERLSGEDDDEDHPWAVLSDAPAFMLEVLVDTHDGWLDEEPDTGDVGERGGEHGDPLPPLHLPTAPRRIKRPDLG